MDPLRIRMVQDSLVKLTPPEGSIVDLFAAELSGAPHDESETGGDNIAYQRERSVLGIMAAAAPFLHAPECILDEVVAEIGAGRIHPADYDHAANAFLRALKKNLGAEFTADLWEAWVEALWTLCKLLSRTERPILTAQAFDAQVFDAQMLDNQVLEPA